MLTIPINITDIMTRADLRAWNVIRENHSFNARWSIGSVLPIMANEIAINTHGIVIAYDKHFGEESVQLLIPNYPTWIDLYFAADNLIARSGDDSHIFIENFVYRGVLKGNQLFELITGS